MLPTFVIGLREGVEASLIVGIVAAFLRQQGRADALRLMWFGVGFAVTLCIGVAVALQLLDRELPQRQQEGLETVVAAVAVGMVTFMIVWMRRHGRHLAAELRESAASAIAQGSAWALIGMAFFAVLREGLETAVFLLAAFQASGDSTAAGTGALLGILLASLLGYGIYRGGVRLNLSRFFRLTSVALVLVAAGLVMSAVHTAHEATWFNSLQSQALNLSAVVQPGTVSSSLLTGVLGLQPRPTVGETAAWLLYTVPMLVYVLWPTRRRVTKQAVLATGALLALALLAAGCGDSKNASGTRQTLNVTLTDDGCDPANLKAKSGTITFDIANDGTGRVSEFEIKNEDGIILGERENIVGGITGSFTLTLKPGRYVMSCPNGDSEDQGVLVVSGKPVASRGLPEAALARAVKDYRAYVVSESALLGAGVDEFVDALEAGDLARAKSLFGPARLHYESIEPVAESFGDLDPRIDARAGDVAEGEKWTGFHHIEQILWQQNTTAGTAALGRQLRADVAELRRKVKTLEFQPAQLANGSVELLDEVARSKITGEEDRYSHTDLSDFQGNLDGSRKAFDLLCPALEAQDESELAQTIAEDRKALAQQIDALAEPLSTVAAKVSG